MAKKIDWSTKTDKALVQHLQTLGISRYADWVLTDWGSYSEALRRKKQRKIAKAAGIKVGGYRGKRRLSPQSAPSIQEPTKKAA